MKRLVQWRDLSLVGAKKLRRSKKLRYIANQVRPIQLTVMLQGRRTMFITMLGPLLDKLIQFIYFVVDRRHHQSRNTSLNNVLSCNQTLELATI